ncbi:MAG TPA: hypothetical protein VEH04_16935 [Verrucomicrobiae bacterium]|nr:hypothetical protein [Verrucomicrobiae bacterium]
MEAFFAILCLVALFALSVAGYTHSATPDRQPATPDTKPAPRNWFFVLSLRDSPRDGFAVFQGPGVGMLTRDLAYANRLTAAQVAERPDLYNDRVNTVAIPVDDVQAIIVAPWHLISWPGKDANPKAS